MTDTATATEHRGSVLIVDDEAAIRGFLTSALGRAGYDVCYAGDGLEAQEQLTKRRFDTAVLDIKMPGMDGIQLLRIIKHMHPHTSVIMTTGFASVDTASDAVRLGAEDYLLKPVHLSKLEMAVDRAVAKARAGEREKREAEELREREQRLATEKAELESHIQKSRNRLANLDVQLERNSEQIANLCEIGTLITSIQDLEQVFVVLMELGLRFVDGEVGSIMLQQEGELTTTVAWGLEEEIIRSFLLSDEKPIVEHVYETCEEVLIADMESDSRVSQDRVNPGVRCLLSVPIMSREKAVGVMTVVNRTDGEPFTDTDRAMLAAAANFAGVAYENARLHAESLAMQRYEQELKTARRIQMNLLPLAAPTVQGAALAGRCVPARQVGGDLYDFIELGDDRYGVVLGDVSGKGTPAALIMATARTVFRSEARWSSCPGETLQRANDFLCEDTEREKGMFITLVYFIYDARNQTITIANAGHCPPLLWRDTAQSTERLMPTGPLMGFQKGLDYEEQMLQLQSGDMLILYTDGFTETVNQKDEAFGEEALGGFLKDHYALPIHEFLDRLYAKVNAFAGKADQFDDMTLVVLRVD